MIFGEGANENQNQKNTNKSNQLGTLGLTKSWW